MGIYRDLGIAPIINAAGTPTRLGGPIMSRRAMAAMAEAAEDCVPIEQLQAWAGREIARLTGAEAGYVTAGASSALTLATAACICRLDLNKMERLPHTDGFANEVVIPREHRNGYDHAIRAAGARLIEVGMNEFAAGTGSRRTEAWEIEAAITEQTVAIAYFATPDSHPPLEDVAEVSNRRNIPLIVDAAAQLPPTSNLRHFIRQGAALVAFSGGKAIRGPQSTGILAGRKDLMMSAALQHLDFDVSWETWDPPIDLIDKARLSGVPRHGIGRGFKVSKEEIVALIVALQDFANDEYHDDIEVQIGFLKRLERSLENVGTVRTALRISERAGDSHPLLEIHLEASAPSAYDVVSALRAGQPPIYVDESGLSRRYVTINAVNLNEESASIVEDRLGSAIRGDPPRSTFNVESPETGKPAVAVGE